MTRSKFDRSHFLAAVTAGVLAASTAVAAVPGATATFAPGGEMLLAQAAVPKGPAAATPKAAPRSDGLVQAAQRELTYRRYQPGALDGLMGPKTVAALRSFQTAQKIPVTGQLDAVTIKALGLR